MSQKKMYIMSGPSGGAKSTFCNSLLLDDPFLIVCSADHYMVDNQGLYEFSKDKLHFAHNNCFKKAETCLEAGFSVAIDNTNTTYRDMKKYLELAVKHEVDLIVHFFVPAKSKSQDAMPGQAAFAEFLASRNTHKVPLSTIVTQINNVTDLMSNFYNNMEEDFPDFVYESEMHPIYVT